MENQTENTSWPVNVENVQIFSSAYFIWLFCQYFTKMIQKQNFEFEFLRTRLVGSISTDEEQKRLARDVFDTFARLLNTK